MSGQWPLRTCTASSMFHLGILPDLPSRRFDCDSHFGFCCFTWAFCSSWVSDFRFDISMLPLASATHATDPQISALFHALRIPECTPCFKAPRRWPKKKGPRGTSPHIKKPKKKTFCAGGGGGCKERAALRCRAAGWRRISFCCCGGGWWCQLLQASARRCCWSESWP